MKYTPEMDDFLLKYYKGTYIPGDDPYQVCNITNFTELSYCFNHEFNLNKTANALSKRYRKLKNKKYYRIKFEEFIDKRTSFDKKNKESGNYLEEKDKYYIYYYLFLNKRTKEFSPENTVFTIEKVNGKSYVKEIDKDNTALFMVLFKTYDEAKKAHNDWIDFIKKYNYYPEYQNDYIN